MDENQNNDAIQDMVANADNTATNQQITNKVAKPQESETQNLDVLLQDPKLQAEFDKKLEKAINKPLQTKTKSILREKALYKQVLTQKKKK